MSFFHYATYKYVTIRDSRLGVGYYLTAAFIIIFTLAEIFVSKGYLEVLLMPYYTVLIFRCQHVIRSILIDTVKTLICYIPIVIYGNTYQLDFTYYLLVSIWQFAFILVIDSC